MYASYIAAFTIAFVLNVIWENAHMSLYKNFSGDRSSLQRFIRSISDSIKDSLIILTFYAIPGWAIMTTMQWPWHASLYQHFLLVILGAVLAITVELHAIKTGRWQYTDRMPLVPGLNIGLSPLLQMVLLPSTTAILTSCLI